MNQITNEFGVNPIHRTAYMSWLMTSTYSQVAIIAIMSGSLKGAWEKAISDQLFLDVYAHQNPQAFDILEMTGDEAYNKETFLKAAYLVTGSKPY